MFARLQRSVRWAALCGSGVACSEPPVPAADPCGAGVRDSAAVAPELAFERPELQSPTPEPNFGSCLRRVSDHLAHQHLDVGAAGARQRAFDPSGKLVLLRSRQVVRVSDSSVVRELPGASSSWSWSRLSGSELVALEANELLGFSLSAGTLAALAKFDEYARFASAAELAEPSAEGVLVLVGVLPGGGCELLAFDPRRGARLAKTPCPADAVGGFATPTFAGFSPSGRFVLVAWPDLGAARGRGLELWDASFSLALRVGDVPRSFDIALDPNGREWLVSVSAEADGRSAVVARSIDGPGRLGPPATLLRLGRFQPASVSCKARGSASCVVSTGASESSEGAALDNEVLLVSLGSDARAPTLLRLAHHRSRPEFVSEQPLSECPLAPEAVRAEASQSEDGSRVAFSSNWGEHCFGELYLIERHGDDFDE